MPIRGSSKIPAGSVEWFASSTAPAGYLSCNGAAVSRTTYAALFLAISTTYGAGDGSTTFNIPDLRGEFVRGFDDGRGVDAGRVFGVHQAGTRVYDNNGSVVGCPVTTAGTNVDEYSALGFSTAALGGAGVANRATGVVRVRNVALRACIKF